MAGTMRVAAAFVLSLGVYLAPIVTPHAMLFLGGQVWSALWGGEPEVVLRAAEVAATVLAQLLVFLLFLWFLRRPGWLRAAGAAAAVPSAAAGLNYAYLVALPTYFLVEADTAASELIVARRLSELFWLGLDGHLLKRLRPDGVEPQPQTFRLLADGWIAWDAYRDRAPYRIAWSLPRGRGTYQLPKNRSATCRWL